MSAPAARRGSSARIPRVVELLDDDALRAHRVDRRADARLAIGLADGQVAAVDEARVRPGAREHVGQELAAVARHGDDRRILVVAAQHAGGGAGRASGRAELVEQQDARTAQGEVVGDARPHHPRADHGDLGGLVRPHRHRRDSAGAVRCRRGPRSSASARSGGRSLVSSMRRPSIGCVNAEARRVQELAAEADLAAGDAVERDRRAPDGRSRRGARGSGACGPSRASGAAGSRRRAAPRARSASRRGARRGRRPPCGRRRCGRGRSELDRAAARGRTAAHERDVLALDLGGRASARRAPRRPRRCA